MGAVSGTMAIDMVSAEGVEGERLRRVFSGAGSGITNGTVEDSAAADAMLWEDGLPTWSGSDQSSCKFKRGRSDSVAAGWLASASIDLPRWPLPPTASPPSPDRLSCGRS